MESEQTSRHQPKINPAKRAVDVGNLIDVSDQGNPAHAEWEAANLKAPNLEAMRRYRLDRLSTEIVRRNAGGALLYDPLNIRYATDVTNMQVWCAHNPSRYCFVSAEGHIILFDYHNCEHLSADFPLVSETRVATSWFYFGAGSTEQDKAKMWAEEISDLVRTHGGGSKRLLIDKCDFMGIRALEALGVETVSSQEFTEEARKIKCEDELRAMRRAVHTSEVGMHLMWQALKPGMTENQLWSLLHQANIARGGEWIETRLLASGPRTNPWFHECSDRVIEAGDIVAFDTDLIGPYGMCSDISRSWLTPGKQASNEQLSIHAMALDQITYNMELLKPGMEFREFSEKSYQLPDEYFPNRYSCILHGVGLCDEYPSLSYFQDNPYPGVFEPGMVVCFESYIGRVGAREGVKLEKQAVIRDDGLEVLDHFSTSLTPE